jgi:hypothetical protein
MLKYRPTLFGTAILEHVADRMGLLSPELRPLLEDLSPGSQGEGV